MKEGKVRAIETFEPVVPRELLQRLLAAEPGKVDAEDTGLPAAGRLLDDCRLAATLFDPATDLVVIDGGFRSAACS